MISNQRVKWKCVRGISDKCGILGGTAIENFLWDNGRTSSGHFEERGNFVISLSDVMLDMTMENKERGSQYRVIRKCSKVDPCGSF